jgi:Tfp pilus assembly protein PilO
MKLSYREYLKVVALIWIGCIVGFVLIYFLVLVPQGKLKAHTAQRLAETRRICSAARQAAWEETKNELDEQIKDLEKRLKDFVIDPSDAANLTFDISQISSNTNVNSFSITATGSEGITKIANCDHISEKYVYVRFTASFNQFAAFLNALERYRPVIFVDTFSIVRSNEATSGHEVNMRLAVLVRQDLAAKEVSS